jgi:calcium-dependent protein kinase
MDLDKQG